MVNKTVMSRVVKVVIMFNIFNINKPSIHKFSLQEVKSREEKIEEQKTDTKVVARNRRMFGALVGTLQKFNKEEIKKKDVTEKKKVVDLEVEEKTEKEKEEIKNESGGRKES